MWWGLDEGYRLSWWRSGDRHRRLELGRYASCAFPLACGQKCKESRHSALHVAAVFAKLSQGVRTMKRASGIMVPEIAGETTLTAKNQVSLPAKRMRELGWEKGDRLIVEVLSEDMLLLVRRPAHWTCL